MRIIRHNQRCSGTRTSFSSLFWPYIHPLPNSASMSDYSHTVRMGVFSTTQHSSFNAPNIEPAWRDASLCLVKAEVILNTDSDAVQQTLNTLQIRLMSESLKSGTFLQY